MVPRWTLYRYMSRVCVFLCCCVLAGASILTVRCAFVAGETRQHPLPLPGLGSKGASLPYKANEIVVATLFMVPRWRLYQYFPLLLCAGSPQVDTRSHTACVRRMANMSPYLVRVYKHKVYFFTFFEMKIFRGDIVTKI